MIRIDMLATLLALALVLAPATGFAQAATAEKPPAAKPEPKPAGPKDSVTPVPRGGNWSQRHELINSRAVPGEVDVIFLGDSITQGWEKEGKKAWEEHFLRFRPMNAGISGDRTEHVLWRLENGNIEGISPKVAVIMIGTNNAKISTSKQIADGITAIVSKLRKELPDTKILVLGIFPRGADPTDPLRKINEGANAIVKDLHDGTHVYYLDIGDRFLTSDGVLEKKIMPDLLHLSPAGYEIWAESITPKLEELLSAK